MADRTNAYGQGPRGITCEIILRRCRGLQTSIARMPGAGIGHSGFRSIIMRRRQSPSGAGRRDVRHLKERSEAGTPTPTRLPDLRTSKHGPRLRRGAAPSTAKAKSRTRLPSFQVYRQLPGSDPRLVMARVFAAHHTSLRPARDQCARCGRRSNWARPQFPSAKRIFFDSCGPSCHVAGNGVRQRPSRHLPRPKRKRSHLIERTVEQPSQPRELRASVLRVTRGGAAR